MHERGRDVVVETYLGIRPGRHGRRDRRLRLWAWGRLCRLRGVCSSPAVPLWDAVGEVVWRGGHLEVVPAESKCRYCPSGADATATEVIDGVGIL